MTGRRRKGNEHGDGRTSHDHLIQVGLITCLPSYVVEVTLRNLSARLFEKSREFDPHHPSLKTYGGLKSTSNDAPTRVWSCWQLEEEECVQLRIRYQADEFKDKWTVGASAYVRVAATWSTGCFGGVLVRRAMAWRVMGDGSWLGGGM